VRGLCASRFRGDHCQPLWLIVRVQKNCDLPRNEMHTRPLIGVTPAEEAAGAAASSSSGFAWRDNPVSIPGAVIYATCEVTGCRASARRHFGSWRLPGAFIIFTPNRPLITPALTQAQFDCFACFPHPPVTCGHAGDRAAVCGGDANTRRARPLTPTALLWDSALHLTKVPRQRKRTPSAHAN
jgi:hypothetical protein